MKKGFTLIELLAVIVILAMIVLIATPIVLNIINGVKENAAKESANGYTRTVESSLMRIKLKTGHTLSDKTYTVDELKKMDVRVNGIYPRGEVTIKSGKVESAILCINGYNVIYDGNIYNVNGTCSSNIDYNDISINDSILGAIAKSGTNDGVESIKINGETYNIHIYSFEENQIWTSNQIFGDSTDVATETADAKNMVVVKVNGNLTINSGVTVTTISSSAGYGGPKGFLLYVSGTLINNGTISMTARGARAVGQNVYLYRNKNGTYEYIPSDGALGGKGINNSISSQHAENGINGIDRQTGGGGGATSWKGSNYKGGDGAIGSSYSGGTGGGAGSSDGGNGYNGSLNGGKGGNPAVNGGGGAGNPGGSNTESITGANGTGGLLVIFANQLINNGKIESNGSKGAGYYRFGGCGGASGGGSINIFTMLSGTLGDIKAFGGDSTMGGSGYESYTGYSGQGGNGSISTGILLNGKYESIQ